MRWGKFDLLFSYLHEGFLLCFLHISCLEKILKIFGIWWQLFGYSNIIWKSQMDRIPNTNSAIHSQLFEYRTIWIIRSNSVIGYDSLWNNQNNDLVPLLYDIIRCVMCYVVTDVIIIQWHNHTWVHMNTEHMCLLIISMLHFISYILLFCFHFIETYLVPFLNSVPKLNCNFIENV